MFNISKELIIVLVVVLVIFGPSQLPKLAKMFGRTMKDLRAGMEGESEDDHRGGGSALKASAADKAAPAAGKASDTDAV